MSPVAILLEHTFLVRICDNCFLTNASDDHFVHELSEFCDL
jgi:hypothetical protein